ncbi:MAG: metallophosphoesterase family protein [Desulfobacteraceae bacterium]|nr:metallophosphoesterase family protein [Desulfobacteraceae bacterium]
MITLRDKDTYLVGVISDTHGLLRPGIKDVLKDTDLIIHAGDIGKPSVLEALQDIAPVAAVRGNMDYEKWAKELLLTEIVDVGEVLIYVLHDLYELDLEPKAADLSVVVHGHTHQPSVKKKDGVMFLNPGSAGPRRHDYPVSVALLRVQENSVNARIVEIKE